MKMKQLKQIFCVIVLLISNIAGYAQNNNFLKAYNCMQRGSIDSAKTFIDIAMLEPDNKKSAESWLVRGFIYKELYKKYQIENIKSPFRDTAVNDLLLSYRLDSTTAENKENIVGSLNYLAASYYNEAEGLMDSISFHLAIYRYNKFKYLMKRIGHTQNLNTFDVRFYDALGNIYSGHFFSVSAFSSKKKYLDSARKSYDAVLAINPDDFSANYGIGRLYYNQAVNIINNLPIEASIDSVNSAQDTCIHLAKMSLPYMQKAHLLEPLKLDPVIGLEGDNVMLHNEEGFRVNKELEDRIRNQQTSPDDKYQSMIKAGDEAYKAGDYLDAKDAYNSALQLKPNEQYPKDQLNKVEKALGQNKK
jgi:hypothetical protein